MSATSKLEVLHLTRDYPPRINGGLSTAVGQMVAALERHGGDVSCSVISFDGWRRGAPVRDVAPAPGVFRLQQGPDIGDRALHWGLDREPDVVHVHEPMLFDLALEIAGGAPIALSLHVLAHHQDRLRELRHQTHSASVQRRAIDEADAIIAPSNAVAEIVRADFPGAAGKLAVAPLAADDPGKPSRDPVPGALLYCGRFADMSGVDQLTEIAARAGGATLTVAGGLPDNPRRDRRWRERLAHPRIALTGWLDGDALAAERARADIAVAPARFATFGMAVLEAMLAGLPVVAYRAGGLAELVVDGETGALVDPGDVDGLVEAARAIAGDRDRARALGAAARRRAVDEFSWERRIGAVLEVYRSNVV